MKPEEINPFSRLLEAAKTLTQDQIDAVAWFSGGTADKEDIIKEYEKMIKHYETKKY